MSSEIRVVNPSSTQFKMVIHPDGSKSVEYNGTPEELSLVLSQLNKSQTGYSALLEWATKLKRLQPLFVAASFCIVCMALLFWATRPGDAYYQPSSGVSYARSV